jgi:hypothetical protein
MIALSWRGSMSQVNGLKSRWRLTMIRMKSTLRSPLKSRICGWNRDYPCRMKLACVVLQPDDKTSQPASVVTLWFRGPIASRYNVNWLCGYGTSAMNEMNLCTLCIMPNRAKWLESSQNLRAGWEKRPTLRMMSAFNL